MKILWVAPNFPWPATNGGKVRQTALMQRLSERGHKITLLSLAKEMPAPEVLSAVEHLLDRVIVEPRRRVDAVTLIKGIMTLRPLVATVNGRSPGFRQHFECLLKEDFDVVQIEHSYTFESLGGAIRTRRTPFFLTEHNIESDVVGLQYGRLPKFLRFIGRLDAMRYRLWEKIVLRRAVCVVAVSETERQYFDAIGARATALVPNCIDTSVHRRVHPALGSQTLLFIGNYEYAPNVGAVEWLCDEIMPRVWSTHRHAHLLICGYAMPRNWRGRWQDRRLEFRGYVPSIVEVHAECSIFIAPLRAGAGSKLKVIEAMASGLPIVATNQGVSGLKVQRLVHYLHGDDTESLSVGVGRLLNEPATAMALGEAARAYATSHHDWTSAAGILEKVYADHRLGRARNFCKGVAKCLEQTN